MGVLVVTDSAAALEPADAADVAVVPITLSVGDGEYADGALPDAELERLLARHGTATTSAPAPGAWLQAVEGTVEGAVCVTVSDQLSSSHKSARVAAGLAGVPVEVVDSGTAAGAQALVVLAAAAAARVGGDVAEVAEVARRAAGEVRLVGTLSSLDRLVRGGRVPGVAGAAGKMLGVNPLFELRNGRVRPLRPAFSRQGALDRMLALIVASRRGDARAQVVVSHALADLDAALLAERARAAVDPQLVLTGRFGAALLAHAGPGTLGLSWRWA